ncbi:MAG: NUMOD4 domain-containing protein [Salinimicrobium sp.]
MAEIWQRLPSYPGYEVSNRGNVRTWPEGEAVEKLSVIGCHAVRLGDDLKGIHTLVAETFLFRPQNKHEIRHLDGNPKNNHCTNLEWHIPGEVPKKKIQRRTKRLKASTVYEIRNRYAAGEKQAQLARDYKVSIQRIHYIVKRKSFKKLK